MFTSSTQCVLDRDGASKCESACPLPWIPCNYYVAWTGTQFSQLFLFNRWRMESGKWYFVWRPWILSTAILIQVFSQIFIQLINHWTIQHPFLAPNARIYYNHLIFPEALWILSPALWCLTTGKIKENLKSVAVASHVGIMGDILIFKSNYLIWLSIALYSWLAHQKLFNRVSASANIQVITIKFAFQRQGGVFVFSLSLVLTLFNLIWV